MCRTCLAREYRQRAGQSQRRHRHRASPGSSTGAEGLLVVRCVQMGRECFGQKQALGPTGSAGVCNKGPCFGSLIARTCERMQTQQQRQRAFIRLLCSLTRQADDADDPRAQCKRQEHPESYLDTPVSHCSLCLAQKVKTLLLSAESGNAQKPTECSADDGKGQAVVKYERSCAVNCCERAHLKGHKQGHVAVSFCHNTEGSSKVDAWQRYEGN